MAVDLIAGFAQKFRQLRDIRRNPPRLIAEPTIAYSVFRFAYCLNMLAFLFHFFEGREQSGWQILAHTRFIMVFE
jgi:hypothetical protein